MIQELSNEYNQDKLGDRLLTNFDSYLLDALKTCKVDLKITIVSSRNKVREKEIVSDFAPKELTQLPKAWE